MDKGEKVAVGAGIAGAVVLGVLGIRKLKAGAAPPPPPGKAILNVDTTPVAGDVYIDGTFFGIAPVTLELDPGMYYNVSFGDVEGYHTPAAIDVLLDEGETGEYVGQYEPVSGPEQATILGYVRDRQSYDPLAEVQVTLNGQTEQTDNRGVYYFHSLEPGQYTIKFEKVGYLKAEETITLEAGHNEHDQLMWKEVARSISGTVYDSATGNPIGYAKVKFSSGGWVLTDGNGYYYHKVSTGVSSSTITVERDGFEIYSATISGFPTVHDVQMRRPTLDIVSAWCNPYNAEKFIYTSPTGVQTQCWRTTLFITINNMGNQAIVWLNGEYFGYQSQGGWSWPDVRLPSGVSTVSGIVQGHYYGGNVYDILIRATGHTYHPEAVASFELPNAFKVTG